MTEDFEPSDLPDESVLLEVSAMLSRLPRPAIPEDVSARINAALAREAQPAVRRPRQWYLLAAAAAVVIGGSFGWSQLHSATRSSVAASMGDLSAISASLAPELQAGTAPFAAGQTPAVATGAGTSQVAGGQVTAPSAMAAPAPSQGVANPLYGTFAANGAGLAACLSGLGRAGQVPTLVKPVRLSGVAAIALAFRSADARSADLVVVAVDCNATAPHVLGRTTIELR